MSQYEDDDTQEEQGNSQSQSGSFKIDKPPSIDKYFGKLSGSIKLFQFFFKTNLDSKDTKLQIKTSKSSKSSPVLPNTRVNLVFKQKKHKLSLGLKPYCMVPARYGGLHSLLYPYDGGPADLDLVFSTSLPQNIKLTAKVKDKGQMSVKLTRTVDLITNAMKAFVEYSAELNKHGKVFHKGTCEVVGKIPTSQFSLSQKYYMNADQKISYKFSNHNQDQLKLESSLQILSYESKNNQKNVQNQENEQNPQNPQLAKITQTQQNTTTAQKKNNKDKPLYQYKFYSSHKVSFKPNHSEDPQKSIIIKSSFCASQNIFYTNAKFDCQYTMAGISSWDAKYFVNRGKWRFGASCSQKKYDSNEGEEDGEKNVDRRNNWRNKKDKGRIRWQLLVQKDQLFRKSWNGGVYLKEQEWGCRIWGKPSRNHKIELMIRSRGKNDKKKDLLDSLDYGIKYNYNI